VASRTSSRARNKSQRQLESELTNRYFKAKTAPGDTPEPIAIAVKREAKRSVKRKGKKDAVYCICRSDGNEGRPMIECGECNDWSVLSFFPLKHLLLLVPCDASSHKEPP